jgi:pimeloyl-ACP methyl ester carboxylesterase
MVKELRDLIAAIGLPGPYVLVGQSFSGLLVRLYAYQHPEEVAGLVLVDPAHEDQFERFPEAIRKSQKPLYEMQIQQMRQLREQVAVQGSDSAPVLVSIPAGFPEKTADMYRRLATRDATRFDTMIAELEGLEESQAQVRAAKKESLGDIPLVVISHGIPQDIPGMPAEVNREYEQAWQQMQVELAGISSQGKRIVAEGSGHMIHHEKPELVCAAIREVVDAVRAKGMR